MLFRGLRKLSTSLRYLPSHPPRTPTALPRLSRIAATGCIATGLSIFAASSICDELPPFLSLRELQRAVVNAIGRGLPVSIQRTNSETKIKISGFEADNDALDDVAKTVVAEGLGKAVREVKGLAGTRILEFDMGKLKATLTLAGMELTVLFEAKENLAREDINTIVGLARVLQESGIKHSFGVGEMSMNEMFEMFDGLNAEDSFGRLFDLFEKLDAWADEPGSRSFPSPSPSSGNSSNSNSKDDTHSNHIGAQAPQISSNQPDSNAKPNPVAALEAMGLRVFDVIRGETVQTNGSDKTNNGAPLLSTVQGVSWSCLAATDQVRKQVEDSILLPMLHPTVFEEIAKGTRHTFESNLPRAVLFSGPPGTGKTTVARIIASQAQAPLVYLPMESVVSKWYGEGEQKLAKVLELCRKFENGAVIFVDEIDALAQDRSSETHEASRRLLSVLLRNVDGIESVGGKLILLGATNREQDLDKALLSRFDVHIRFPAPDAVAREAIFAKYAKHLPPRELRRLAKQSEGFTGRSIKDVCSGAERQWAGKRVRGEVRPVLPPIDEYLRALERKS